MYVESARSPPAGVRDALPLRHQTPEVGDLERLCEDRAADRGERLERLRVRAAGNERDAGGEGRAVEADPVVEVQAAAVAESDVEQRTRDVLALRERELCRTHPFH